VFRGGALGSAAAAGVAACPRNLPLSYREENFFGRITASSYRFGESSILNTQRAVLDLLLAWSGASKFSEQSQHPKRQGNTK
jgi:hypothetical protein